MHKCTEVTLSESSKNKCAQKEVDNKVVVAVIDLTGSDIEAEERAFVVVPSLSHV